MYMKTNTILAWAIVNRETNDILEVQDRLAIYGSRSFARNGRYEILFNPNEGKVVKIKISIIKEKA